MADKLDIVPVQERPATNLGPEAEDLLEPGQWFWIATDSEKSWDRPGAWIGCVTHVGSNYAEVQSVDGGASRVALSRFDEIATREFHPEIFIRSKVEEFRGEVGRLLGRVREITASLGVAPREVLAVQSQTTSALSVVHGEANVEAHKDALILAKEKTLPALFKEIEKQHEQMARWLKADLIPAQAQLKRMQTATKIIEERIFTVELYAGLIEKMKQIQDGKPAASEEKIRLFQRQHFMDEECLFAYEAGGMEFSDIAEFDAWLLRSENLNRILPFPRCIVTFRVRREEKHRTFETLTDFIKFSLSGIRDADKKTFLYIRNGEQVFRLITGIDFGEKLFPDVDESALLGNPAGDLWIKFFCGVDKVVSQRDYDAVLFSYESAVEKYEAAQAAYEKEMEVWEALSEEERKDCKKPSEPWHLDPDRHGGHDLDRYEKLTTDHLYYDDAMLKLHKEMTQHNRLAVVLQGVLDRSPALHPHPPWRLWTPEGFQAGIELIYDSSRVLPGQPPPDFEVYRAQLNKSLKPGCVTVGQQHAWEREEARKENARRRLDWRSNRDRRDLETFRPRGNPGPGRFAQVVRLTKKGQCVFEWHREYKRVDSVHEANRPILTEASFQADTLLNVSAYTAGDFRMFYKDPRTRAEYLQWAPYLLAAEDYAQGKAGPRTRKTDHVVQVQDEDEDEDGDE